MKTIFMPAKYNGKIELDKIPLEKLPKKLGLVTTAQFLDAAQEIKNDVDAFLYIGSGEFHPLGVALNTSKEVFTFNPITSAFSRLDKKEVESYKKNKKIRYAKFLHADNIGILVSLKPGQYSYKKAEEIRNKLSSEGKNAFIFVFDTLDSNELDNFPFIDFWVNTACPRIADDKDKKNVIDMSEI